MPTIIETNWIEFRNALAEYSSLSWERRKQFIFRGHSHSAWLLQTTLDRVQSFESNAERTRYMEQLIREFRRESVGLVSSLPEFAIQADWELLGRHHGLPTPILDWTESPFVAAFFAFDQAVRANDGKVSVWVLDRDVFSAKDIPSIEVIDDEEAIRFNPRAIEQRGLFLRINNIDQRVEDLLDDAVSRFDLPAKDRHLALADLDEMMINARSLFRSLDAAAALAARRVSMRRMEHD